MKRKASAVLLASVLTYSLFGCADSRQPQAINPINGEVSNATDWEYYAALNEYDGGYVQFHAENTGDVALTITINEENAKSLAPGEAGDICVQVTNSLWGEREYTFRAVPTLSGQISLRYDIVQTCNE